MVERVNNPRLRGVMEKLRKYRYPALILAAGLLLLLIPTGGKKTEAVPVKTEEASEYDLEAFTLAAEQALSRIPGAGQVTLLLTLESDGMTSYLSDRSESLRESDSQIQQETVLISRDGDQVPVVVTRNYPQYRGAVALCEGGDSPAVVLCIKEALSSLTGLGMDKITVLSSN